MPAEADTATVAPVEIPKKLGETPSEELGALSASLLDALARFREITEPSDDDIVEAKRLAEGLKAVGLEVTTRTEAANARRDAMAAILAELPAEATEETAEEVTAEPVLEEEPVAVAAVQELPTVLSVVPPVVVTPPAPLMVPAKAKQGQFASLGDANRIAAAQGRPATPPSLNEMAETPGVTMYVGDKQCHSAKEFIQEFATRMGSINVRSMGFAAPGEKGRMLATITQDIPEAYNLVGLDAQAKRDKMEATGFGPNLLSASSSRDPRVLAASAADPGLYVREPIMILSPSNESPTMDSMPSYALERGKVTLRQPYTLADIQSTTTGHRTRAENDLTLDPTWNETTFPSPKSHGRIGLPTWLTFENESWHFDLRVSNDLQLNAPDLVAEFLALAAGPFWTAEKEIVLLNALSAAPGAGVRVKRMIEPFVTGQHSHQGLTSQIWRATVRLRSHYRLASDIPMVVHLHENAIPFLAKDVMLSDTGMRFFTSSTIGEGLSAWARVLAWAEMANIRIVKFVDDPSGFAQGSGAETAAGPFGDYLPADGSTAQHLVHWAIYPQGTWVVMRQPGINLGIVRDSILNAANDYSIWNEEFFTPAQIGRDSYWVTSHLGY